MNIRATLLADHMQSKALANRVANYACTSPDTFDELIQCFLSDDYRLAQRASYSLGLAALERQDLIEPYIGILVNQLKRKDVHDALPRNITRIFEEITIPEKFHGEIMDTCFGFIQNRQTAIAIRAYSLTILFKFSLIYPEIKTELRYLIDESLPYEKPAFVSRGRKILAQI